MSRAARISNLLAVVIPFVAFLAAIVLFWGNGVGAHDLVFFAVMYLLTGFGVTIGFHRLLTHRSFATSKPVEYLFAVLGLDVGAGPRDLVGRPTTASTTRTPTRRAIRTARTCGGGDGPARASSTRTSAGSSASRGSRASASTPPTSMEDPGMRRINRAFPWLVVARASRCPRSPATSSPGRITGALTGLLWGGLVRVFFIHHVTWSINSVCHFFGRRRFDIEDHSTNVFWLALPTLGEAWHHNHHAFPRSAVHGLGRRELDPSAWRHPRDGEARPRVERRAHHARAPGAEADRAGRAVAATAPRRPRRDAGRLAGRDRR